MSEEFKLRYIFVMIGAILADICVMAFRVKMGWTETFWPNFGELLLWAITALILLKTMSRPNFRRIPIRFREIVIIASMVFGTIVSNVSFQYAQWKVFGTTYVPSYEDPVPEPGSTQKPVIPTIPQKLAMNLVPVVGEEILFRWIILGALMMALSPGWSVLISSLIFGAMHLPVKIMVGFPLAVGLSNVLPTFAIGFFCGIAFIRYGLVASIAIHFLVNLVGWFAYNQTYIADAVIWGSASVALIVLPFTLLFTRRTIPVTTLRTQ